MKNTIRRLTPRTIRKKYSGKFGRIKDFFNTDKVYPFPHFPHNEFVLSVKIDIHEDKIHNKEECFLNVMCGTLRVTRALGLFPVNGISDAAAGTGASALSFKSFSKLSIISAISILPVAFILAVASFHFVNTIVASSAGLSGGIANAMAGAVFYANATVCALLFRGICKGWPALARKWEVQEKTSMNSMVSILPDLKFKVYAIGIFILVCSLVEHFLSITIQIPKCITALNKGNFETKKCLKEYCLTSHTFIFETVKYSTPFGAFIFIVSKMATVAWNFQDLFLMQVSFCMKARFRHINQIVKRMDLETSRLLDWRRVRELYADVTNLSRDLSSLLSPLVLLSFANNLFFICLQMLNGLAPSQQGLLHNAYFFGSFGFIIFRVVGVALSAASIPLEAKKMLPNIRCCPARTYCVEVQRFCHQIATDDVALTGLGFFTVNRSFILAVAGAIATYEVVLLQFDSDSPIVVAKPTVDSEDVLN